VVLRYESNTKNLVPGGFGGALQCRRKTIFRLRRLLIAARSAAERAMALSGRAGVLDRVVAVALAAVGLGIEMGNALGIHVPGQEHTNGEGASRSPGHLS
jgi:hypothetical protein